jgi:sigma-E factor negative regulatory protein RseA
MKAKISALMDGELGAPETEQSLQALREDGEAFEAWREYHLISDALQGRALLASDCLRRVSQRLAAEPILMGPLPSQVVPAARAPWFAPSALAASVAAVALVGWMAFAPQQETAPGLPPVAQLPQPAQPASGTLEPARVPLTTAAQDYLFAHQAYSPRNSLQGMAPYVRSVSVEASAPGKP